MQGWKAKASVGRGRHSKILGLWNGVCTRKSLEGVLPESRREEKAGKREPPVSSGCPCRAETERHGIKERDLKEGAKAPRKETPHSSPSSLCRRN